MSYYNQHGHYVGEDEHRHTYCDGACVTCGEQFTPPVLVSGDTSEALAGFEDREAGVVYTSPQPDPQDRYTNT